MVIGNNVDVFDVTFYATAGFRYEMIKQYRTNSNDEIWNYVDSELWDKVHDVIVRKRVTFVTLINSVWN